MLGADLNLLHPCVAERSGALCRLPLAGVSAWTYGSGHDEHLLAKSCLQSTAFYHNAAHSVMCYLCATGGPMHAAFGVDSCCALLQRMHDLVMYACKHCCVKAVPVGTALSNAVYSGLHVHPPDT